ncbi:hypothetical protein AB9F39_37595, partial [Rhizobium leguminosarum]|uniref:hypothetical protein n=1 Tax=Rhizobium leguminosarum TaxID=384 RepID=UPI003F992AA9
THRRRSLRLKLYTSSYPTMTCGTKRDKLAFTQVDMGKVRLIAIALQEIHIGIFHRSHLILEPTRLHVKVA